MRKYYEKVETPPPLLSAPKPEADPGLADGGGPRIFFFLVEAKGKKRKEKKTLFGIK